MTGDPPHPGAPQPPEDATWWAELEEQLGHPDSAEVCRQFGLPPNPPPPPAAGDELELPATLFGYPVVPMGEGPPRVIRVEQSASWRVLQPKTPGQRCACSAPPADALPGARAVCPHGRAWRWQAPAGPGHQPRRWVELRGLARWWAARQARR